MVKFVTLLIITRFNPPQTYLLVAEMATQLTTLYDMCEDSKLTKEERTREAHSFYFYLMKLLNNPKHKKLNLGKKISIIFYKGTVYTDSIKLPHGCKTMGRQSSMGHVRR